MKELKEGEGMTIAKGEIAWADQAVRSARTAIGHEHSREVDLARLVELAEPKDDESALDFVTGLGYVARAIAPFVKLVDAFDPDEMLLTEAAAQAEQEGLGNIRFKQGDPLAIPFDDARYDIATARLALRHTRDAASCLKEIKRVLKPAGRLLIIDSLAPPHAELSGFLEKLMAQRDKSHVKSYTLAEWENLVEREDFNIDQVEIYPKEHDFGEWAERFGADSDSVRMLGLMLHGASNRVKRHFRVVEKKEKVISFVTWMILIRARPLSDQKP